ncbi:MAG: AbrB/MazE/SpoVT family DNA-binding domain-containing protein [Pyrinomonadaceae bacterium]|nr:AbrB/MazE/SpoVT family DNA-binding domain-containing protein [Pyrinomonadaceae bacterium]
MKTRIVKIGNSLGVRIPKPLLEQSQLSEEVEMQAQVGEIVIRSVRKTREGWAESFKTMSQNKDDVLIDGDETAATNWDETEWQW